jgi:RNA polymerase sigma-70 factor (ECF subfamily)
MMAHVAPASPPPQALLLRWRPRLVVLTRALGHYDGLLLRLAQSRDRDAFQELFAHFAPRVKAYVMRFSASDQAADDLAQEAMLTVWRKAELFDPERASASTWIFTIARNLRIDLIRRERQPRFDREDPTLRPPPEMGAEESASVRDRDEALRAALAELPAEQREIVRLSFYSERSHGEIAETLKIPLGTVKSRLRLAMARLRTALEDTP